MIKISLTDFVDFSVKTGTPKLTKVKQIKGRPKYHPSMDFYKIVREGIIEYHINGENDKSQLNRIVSGNINPKKIDHYQEALRGYKKFIGNKQIEWSSPPSDVWGPEGLNISINPELGLSYGNELHIIKMYFKAEPLSKRKVDTVTLLLFHCFHDQGFPDANYGILDVKRGKIYESKRPNTDLMPLLHGEAQSFITIWNQLGD